MSKNVKINSPEWIDLIFKGRNKEYGAYTLRKNSSRGHIIGMITVTVVVLLVAAIPSIASFIDKVTPVKESDYLGQIDSTVELAEIEAEEESLQDEILREEVTATPPPPLKATVQFTPPTIVDDDDIDEESEMRTQDELRRVEGQISIQTIVGVDDPDAVDIRDLQREREVIVQVKKEEVYTFVEEMPVFPGGLDELRAYLARNTRYPAIAAENGIEGRVTIKFVVRPDGSVDDIQVLQGVDRSLNEEAVRVVGTLPKWTPGRQNGVAVSVYYTVPVVFQLQK